MLAYLAGPDVFLPDAVEIGHRKRALCEHFGLVGLYPLDEGPSGQGVEREDRRIFAACTALMRRADLGIFNLTPFRGPSADVGTVYELGFMAGLGKPVFGYTSVGTSLYSRVAGASQHGDGKWRDRDGFLVEDFGNADNLMIDGILASEGNGFVRLDRGGALDCMEAFEQCVRLASERVGSSG